MMFAVALLALQAAAVAEPRPPALVAMAARKILIPAGTSMRFVTLVELDSRTARQGQRFAMRVEQDVIINGVVAIPRGTAAVGEIDSVSQKGMVGKSGSLAMKPLFVEYDGRRLYLDGVTRSDGPNSETAAAATAIVTSGLGLVITGKSARVPIGTSMPGWSRNDATVTLAVR
jgi:hypothetical protein